MRAVARGALVAIGATLLATSVAFAAGLTIDPEDLTTYSSDSQIPTLSTCSLTSSADSYGEQLTPNGTHGSETTMLVSSLAATNKRSFVRFNLSGCSFAATADVQTASLGLYLSTAPNASRTHDANRITASWVESTVTWNTQPAVAASPTASVATGTTDGVTLTWNVKTDVKDFVEGVSTNNGWRIADAAEAAVVARTGTFRTREHATTSTRPTLTITYYP